MRLHQLFIHLYLFNSFFFLMKILCFLQFSSVYTPSHQLISNLKSQINTITNNNNNKQNENINKLIINY